MPECVESVVAKQRAVSIDESGCESECESVWEYGCFPVLETSAPCAPPHGKVKIASLAQPVADYLLDLRSKLSEAAEFAQSHTDAAQQGYAAHYNLRARQKKFQEGDQVIGLAPENTGKMGNRWLGPGTVVSVKSPYSYLVDLGNGNRSHMHANKMRHFVARVQGCGVIAECETEFGKVLSPEVVVNESVMPSVTVDPEKLSHLDEGQRAELVEVLDEFVACFSDKPGLCDVVTHRVVTTPDFVPKQMRPYRVPIAFRADVSRQIRELLDMGLIRPSISPMASPIVCVAKKSGGVRIACDYRYLNSFTVGDAYPMSTINEDR